MYPLKNRYTFVQTIAVTDERPEIVSWNASSVHMVELTIPLETGAENAGTMKQIRNAELVESGTQTAIKPHTTVEVGSRGFIHFTSFSQMDTIVNARPKLRIHQEEVSHPASEGSFCIRCRRNKRDEVDTEIINIVEDIISRNPKIT